MGRCCSPLLPCWTIKSLGASHGIFGLRPVKLRVVCGYSLSLYSDFKVLGATGSLACPAKPPSIDSAQQLVKVLFPRHTAEARGSYSEKSIKTAANWLNYPSFGFGRQDPVRSISVKIFTANLKRGPARRCFPGLQQELLSYPVGIWSWKHKIKHQGYNCGSSFHQGQLKVTDF